MRKIYITMIALLAFISTTINIAVANEQNCPVDKLYRDVDADARLNRLTPSDDPLFSSEHYCFGYYNPAATDKNELPGFYNDQQIMKLQRSYVQAFQSLNDNEKRIAFVHMFLKKLSHKALVMPLTARRIDKQIKIILTSKDNSANSTTLWQLPITLSNHGEIHQGLMALPEKTKMAAKWPKLVKLVNQLVNGNYNYIDNNEPDTTLQQNPTEQNCGPGGSCDSGNNDEMTWDEWKAWAEGNEMDTCDPYLCNLMWEPSPVQPELERCMVMYYPDGSVSDMMYCWVL